MKIILLSVLAITATISAQSTVLVTHADGTTHTFIIPLEMEQSFDSIRAVRVKRAQPDPQTPNTPGVVLSEEKNTGEFLEALTFETFERAIQNPTFQPVELKAKVEKVRVELEADQKKVLDDAKEAIRKARKEKPKANVKP